MKILAIYNPANSHLISPKSERMKQFLSKVTNLAKKVTVTVCMQDILKMYK